MHKMMRFLLLSLWCGFWPAYAMADDALNDEVVYRVNLGRADDVKLLIEKGASPDQVDKNGIPLLALAAARKDEEGPNVIQALLDAGANINITDPYRETALFYAAKNGNLESAKTLLAGGINYYAENAQENIARTIAHRAGHNNIVEAMDAFVNNQTTEVNKKYDERNEAIQQQRQDAKAERKKIREEQQQKIMERDEAWRKESEEIEKQNQEAHEQALADREQVIEERREAKQDLSKKRTSGEFQQAMYDLAFNNCAFQYWSYVQDVGQSSELSADQLNATILQYKNNILPQTTAARETYKLDGKYTERVSLGAKKRILNELHRMPSNIYRHEHGVGKMEDMNSRCANIAKEWNQKAEDLPEPEESGIPQSDNRKASSMLVHNQGIGGIGGKKSASSGTGGGKSKKSSKTSKSERKADKRSARRDMTVTDGRGKGLMQSMPRTASGNSKQEDALERARERARKGIVLKNNR